MPSLDLIIPVYNETDDVVARTVRAAQAAFSAAGDWTLRVIVVDDGSRQPVNLAALAGDPSVTLLRQSPNRGYGAALKAGIRAGTAPWIAIADADGTYPVDRLPELAREMAAYDTVVGTRTGTHVNIPWLRRFPKACLNRFASYLAGSRIVDLNSGMRVFTRELAGFLWNLFPAGFSFTSTMTMGSLRGGFRVKEIPIDYFKREGSSSIAPIKDTVRFFKLAFRLGLLFAPLRIFMPIAALLFGIGAIKGLGIDYPRQGFVGNLSVACLLSALQIFLMGLVAELVVLSRKLSAK